MSDQLLVKPDSELPPPLEQIVFVFLDEGLFSATHLKSLVLDSRSESRLMID